MLILAVPVLLFVMGALLVPTLLFALPVVDALLTLCELAYPIGSFLLLVAVFQAVKFPKERRFLPWAIAGVSIIAIHLLAFC
ncbi:MAG TPA: hypothetical protein VLB83_01035 [Candidatus Paceibacterota bacterium]|nr:hypothetical protein [Candidatus Paceibacterota bacterium]